MTIKEKRDYFFYIQYRIIMLPYDRMVGKMGDTSRYQVSQAVIILPRQRFLPISR